MAKKKDTTKEPVFTKVERPAPWPDPPERTAGSASIEADWSGRKFRKLPVIIEAVQIGEQTEVNTPFGTVYGAVGDWLITAANGQQWFCTDEYFRENYEPVAEEGERK